jgi:hypothetical protein
MVVVGLFLFRQGGVAMESRQHLRERMASKLEQTRPSAYPTRDDSETLNEQDIEFFSGLLQGGVVAPADKHKGDEG